MIHKDIIISKIIDDIMVRCPFKLCKWKGNLSQMRKHSKDCLMDPNKAPKWLFTEGLATQKDGLSENKEIEVAQPLSLRARLYQSEEQRDKLFAMMDDN
ncbi:hypothetical protein MHBO_002711 [Bonamia ostreae]|uniref:Uncharacterized protein n=1 Tax=Bonamia ostreae TaxID=126728 RepID=A0ABV2ANP3_9EUKA